MEELINQIILLHQYSRSVEKQLDSCKKEIAVFQKYSDVFSSYQAVQQQLLQVKSQKQQISDELSFKNAEINRLAKIQKENQVLLKELDKQKKTKQNLHSSNLKNQLLVVDLKGKVKQLQEFIDLSKIHNNLQLRGQLYLKQRQIEQKDRIIAQLTASTPESQSFLSSLTHTFQESLEILRQKSFIAQKHQKDCSSCRSCQKKERQICYLNSNISKLNQEIHVLRHNLEQALSTVKDLQRKKHDLKLFLNQQDDRLCDLSRQIKALKHNLSELSEVNEDLAAKNKVLTQKISLKNSQQNISHQTLDSFISSTSSLSQGRKELEQEIQSLRNSLSKSNQLIALLQQNVQMGTKLVEKKQNDLIETITSLSLTNQALQQQLLKQSVVKISEQLLIKNQKTELLRLQSLLNESQKVINQQNKRLEQAKELQRNKDQEIQALEVSNTLLKKQAISSISHQEALLKEAISNNKKISFFLNSKAGNTYTSGDRSKKCSRSTLMSYEMDSINCLLLNRQRTRKSETFEANSMLLNHFGKQVAISDFAEDSETKNKQQA